MSKIITKFTKNCLFQLNQPFSQLVSKISTNTSLHKQIIDKSKVPIIDEKDIKEVFIHGSGPGGQNVNKLSNCVQLTHLPTGLVVKCHQDRSQLRNRSIARQLLQTKLDDLLNGDQSVSAQRHRLITSKFAKRDKRREKIRELKSNYKLRKDLNDLTTNCLDLDQK